jgi:glycine cleavage system aminomethyltransferase T
MSLPPFIQALTFTGWEDETMSWKETCYIHAGLNANPATRIYGPDVIKLLSDCTTNSHARFPIGRAKHVAMTDNEGRIYMNGMTVRIAAEEVWVYSLGPWIAYHASKGKYNVRIEDYTAKDFNFQCAGPRILEVLEAATGEDLHDIPFMGHKASQINGKEVRIMRFGMGGTLAYEVHGNMDDAKELYAKIVEIGQSYGIRRLGWQTYSLNHTENGYPQESYHFTTASREDAGFLDFLSTLGFDKEQWPGWPVMRGSSGSDINKRYRNPIEVGFDSTLSFDHDFPGKSVLEKLVKNPKRKSVTLVWNPEDILSVNRSMYETDAEPYRNIDIPAELAFGAGGRGPTIFQDDVLNEKGEIIGYSSGREYTLFSRNMISLGTLDVDYIQTGTTVFVLWGEPGKRQTKIRATVEPFPILAKNMTMNRDYDIDSIPRLKK